MAGKHECSENQCRAYFSEVYQAIGKRAPLWTLYLLVGVILTSFGYANAVSREARSDNRRIEEKVERLATKEDVQTLKDDLKQYMKDVFIGKERSHGHR